MKVEHSEISKDDVPEEMLEFLKKVDQSIDLLEQFFNINQISPRVALHAVINALPPLAKHDGMPFDIFKSLMLGAVDAFEKRWDEL